MTGKNSIYYEFGPQKGHTINVKTQSGIMESAKIQQITSIKLFEVHDYGHTT